MTFKLLTNLKINCLAFFGSIILKLLYSSYKINITGQANLPDKQAVIYAFWHNKQLALPLLYRHISKKQTLNILISAHRDGRIIAKIIKYFGISSVAGSSSRGGVSALKNLIKCLKNGEDVAITPDGPKGPIYKCKNGIADLALHTDTCIIPISYTSNNFWEFKSWDRMILPKPFAEINFLIGDKIIHNSETSEELALKIEKILNQIN